MLALICGTVLSVAGALSIMFSARFAKWQKSIEASFNNLSRGRVISFGVIVICVGLICIAAAIWG